MCITMTSIKLIICSVDEANLPFIILSIFSISFLCLIETGLYQHHLKRMPAHRKVATSQTSELVGKAPKICNSYPVAIFK